MDSPWVSSDSEGAPEVSVCIAHYGDPEVLRACLDSVRQQACSFDFEILVHDDASPDDIGAVVARCPGVRWLRSDANVGFCVANNRMALGARGRYLLLLNNDAELFPDALQTLADEADRIREPAILGLPQYDQATGRLDDLGRLCDPFLTPIHNLDPAVRDVAMVAGACLWIPAKLWRDLGGFPEWFEMIAEDLYLCCQARLRGIPVRVAGRSGFRHRIGTTIGGGARRGHLSTTVRRRSLSERNRCYTMLVCYPGPWHLVAFLVYAILLVMEGAVLAVKRADPRLFTRVYWFALQSVWHVRERIAAERIETQVKRKVSAAVFFSAFRPTLYKLVLLARHGWPSVR
jgi:GT2 family glycosyltransferase